MAENPITEQEPNRFVRGVTNFAQNAILNPLQYSLGMKMRPRDQLIEMQIAAERAKKTQNQNVQEYLNNLTPEQAQAIGLSPAQLKLAQAAPFQAYDDVVQRAFERETFSTTPQYGVDKLGNRMAYQLGDRGNLKIIDYNPGNEYDTLDVGGSIHVYRKGTRTLVDVVPKTMTPQQRAQHVIEQKKATQEDKEKIAARRRTLRTDYGKAIKIPLDALQAFRKVEESANLNSAYGDVALLTNFMKVLDPGSIVRESEFEMIANTGGLPVAIANAFRKSANGELLSQDQRKMLTQAAMANLQPSIDLAAMQTSFYTAEAARQGVDPKNTFVNPFADLDVDEMSARRAALQAKYPGLTIPKDE
tara:strand:- start:2095 stop:3174 length:1080 start_codon:yes stop_codon:yes gene_type:complete